MKLKVIGWTHYDDPNYENDQSAWASYYAVLKEVSEKGYLFTGYHHQEFDFCCPVLNNGKKVIFSQRGFGGLMALAHGYNKPLDYALFAFPVDDELPSKLKIPTDQPNKSLIVDEKELLENFEIKVDLETYATADILRELTLKSLGAYDLMDKGDFIKLVCDKSSCKYKIVSIDRKKDVSVIDEYNYKYKNCGLLPDKELKELIDRYENAPQQIILKLEYQFSK